MTIGLTALPMLALLCAELWIRPGVRAFTVLAAINSLVTGAWGLGVFMTTTPRPGTPERARDASEEWSVLRSVTRATQWTWVASQVLWLGANQLILGAGSATAYSNIFLIMGTLAMFAAGAGLFAFLLYLIRVAIWANDTDLADRLRLIPLILSVSVVVLVAAGVVGPVLSGGVVTFMLVPLTGVSGLFLLYSLWTTIGVSWQLGSLGFWALRNRSTQLESSQRRSARIVARIENGLARPIHRTEPAPQGHKPANPQGNYIPKCKDEPIDLLDDGKS